MGKIQNVLNGLFTKVDDTEKRYEKALEEKQELLIEVTAELTEKQAGLKDLHKMAILGDVSESTYQKEADAVEKLQNRVSEIQREMQLIVEYKSDDVQKILYELETNNKEVHAERQKELHALRLKVLEAKRIYLQTLLDSRNDYYSIVAPERKIEALKAKLGMKNRLDYMTGAYDALSMYSVAGAGYINLEVNTKAVHDALQYSRIDSQLQNELKKHGIQKVE